MTLTIKPAVHISCNNCVTVTWSKQRALFYVTRFSSYGDITSLIQTRHVSL